MSRRLLPTRRTARRLALPLAGLSLAATAAGPLVLGVDAHRGHLHKVDFTASQLVPSERTGPIECEDGFAGDFACDGIDLLSFVPSSEMFTTSTDVLTGGGLSDIWGWVDPESGDEYVVFGKTNGTAFYRVTDPTDPEYLGEVPNNGAQLIWHDIKVVNDHALIVSESVGHGIQVFDLTRLRDMAAAPVTPFPLALDAIYADDASAHNIVTDDVSDRAYLVGSGVVLGVAGVCDAGLHALDMADPTNPMYLGCYAADDNSYVHDAQCAVYHGPDAEHHGKQICVTSNEDFVDIVDVTDMTAPVRLSRVEYDSTSYAHQGWMSEDQAFYFHGDELDEQDFGLETRTVVVDMRDLDDAKVHFTKVHDTEVIDHNMYTHRGLLFQSNYEAGLRVLDPSRVAEGVLPEVAFFDTYPDSDAPEFNGTWSNYPYFPSGTIAVTGIGEGLFLLQLDD